MKKLTLIVGIILISLTSFGQNPIQFKFQSDRVTASTAGTPIARSSEFDVILVANGNGNTTTRQILVDLEYDRNNFDFVSANHTGTGGNGGILPQGSTISITSNNYPGYNWVSNASNSTSNGTTNYQYTNYRYDANNPKAILRTNLTWATPNGMPYNGYDRLIVFRFRLKAGSTAFTFDPIKLNFVAAWNATGTLQPTFQTTPLTSTILMDQNVGKLVTANVDINSNLLNVTNVRVSFRDTLTNTGQLFTVNSNGVVDINQSLLAPNKVYEVSILTEMDKLYTMYNNAITLSDFTTAQNEFVTMGLDGSRGQNLRTGQSLYVADINKNKVIDGGDLPRLLAQVAGLDTLTLLPSQYTAGSAGWMSLPTWRSTDATTVAGQVEWGILTPNEYGSNLSKVSIDLREFNGTNILPDSIKSLQIFDVYTGPAKFESKDGTWAYYSIPTNLSTVPTSTYQPYLRSMNGGYGVRAEFEFNNSINNSWTSITPANWNTITYPRVFVTTGDAGSNKVVDLKYLLWGDVNRSHSSQVVSLDNGVSNIQTNAVVSLQSNAAFTTMASGFINTPHDITSIDVNLSNATVVTNYLEIPVNIDTKGANLGGLQFQFEYDPTKIKFEDIKTAVPNTWFIFATAKDGVVKFGALDQNNKTPIKGTNTPFILKFSTIGEGVNILTSVKVSPTMDASDIKGNQLGINLNTTKIKLTGYNNF